MTVWSDLPAPKRRIATRAHTPMLVLGSSRSDIAYLNAAARDLLGQPSHIRWQVDDDERIGIASASFLGTDHDDSLGRSYKVIRGQVTCSPILALLDGEALPLSLELALTEPGRLVVVAKVQR